MLDTIKEQSIHSLTSYVVGGRIPDKLTNNLTDEHQHFRRIGGMKSLHMKRVGKRTNRVQSAKDQIEQHTKKTSVSGVLISILNDEIALSKMVGGFINSAAFAKLQTNLLTNIIKAGKERIPNEFANIGEMVVSMRTVILNDLKNQMSTLKTATLEGFVANVLSKTDVDQSDIERTIISDYKDHPNIINILSKKIGDDVDPNSVADDNNSFLSLHDFRSLPAFLQTSITGKTSKGQVSMFNAIRDHNDITQTSLEKNFEQSGTTPSRQIHNMTQNKKDDLNNEQKQIDTRKVFVNSAGIAKSSSEGLKILNYSHVRAALLKNLTNTNDIINVASYIEHNLDNLSHNKNALVEEFHLAIAKGDMKAASLLTGVNVSDRNAAELLNEVYNPLIRKLRNETDVNLSTLAAPKVFQSQANAALNIEHEQLKANIKALKQQEAELKKKKYNGNADDAKRDDDDIKHLRKRIKEKEEEKNETEAEIKARR